MPWREVVRTRKMFLGKGLPSALYILLLYYVSVGTFAGEVHLYGIIITNSESVLAFFPDQVILT